MSGTEKSPTTPSTRGIEPAASGLGPPPAPDFGVDTTRWDDSPAVDDVAEAASHTDGIAPPPPSAPAGLIGIVIGIVAVLVLILGLVAVGISVVPALTGTPTETSESDDSGPSDSGGSATAVEASLQSMIDEYQRARDTGTLWTTIPDTHFNRTALSAFFYLLTDLKLAASFGADTSDYLEQADEWEQKLLNEEPLGSDVEITMKDRTFSYDGETGEGGYTAN